MSGSVGWTPKCGRVVAVQGLTPALQSTTSTSISVLNIFAKIFKSSARAAGVGLQSRFSLSHVEPSLNVSAPFFIIQPPLWTMCSGIASADLSVRISPLAGRYGSQEKYGFLTAFQPSQKIIFLYFTPP